MNSAWAVVSALLALLSVAICIVALFVVQVNRKPSSATAWLMLIFGLPYVGAILFLMLGSPKLSRRRRAQQRTMDDVLRKAVVDARLAEIQYQLWPVASLKGVEDGPRWRKRKRRAPRASNEHF